MIDNTTAPAPATRGLRRRRLTPVLLAGLAIALVAIIALGVVLAIGPNGKNASGWPVKAPAHTMIMAATPEPDGGLLVQLLNSSLVIAPGASVGDGCAQRLADPLAAEAPDFPGTLTVIRYLPDGTVAR